MRVNTEKRSQNVSLLTEDVSFKLKSKNKVSKTLILILSTILTSLLIITIYLVNKNITSNESQSSVLGEKSNNDDTRRRLSEFTTIFGGSGGDSFNLYDNGNKITRICVRHGSLIDRITVTFENGKSESTGGSGGNEDCYTSSCITGVNIRSGRLIDGIQFIDNRGTSNFYGGNGGILSNTNWNPQCLTGISGKSGSKIDSIQFGYNRLCNINGKLEPCGNDDEFKATDDGLAHFFSPILKFDRAADTFPMDAQIYYNYVIKGEKNTNLLNYVCLRDNRCENKDKNLNNIVTYYQVFRCNNQVRIVYYWWYGYQPQCAFGQGSHEADWERVIVILSQDLSQVAAVVYHQHSGHLTKTSRTNGFEIENGHKPVVYVGKKAHGSYPSGNRESSVNECQYYGDFRVPSASSIWNTENNLIDLSKKEQEWMNDRNFHSELGTRPQNINPSNAYCDIETCEGTNILGADTAGCIQSDCLPGYKRDFEGSLCHENCDSDCTCALWCCPRAAIFGCATCGAAPFCDRRKIISKVWTIPQNDQYLL